MSVPEKNLKVDSKKRITLGKIIPDNVTSYDVEVQENNVIILRPRVEIPLEELWLYKNKEAFKSVQKGIEDSYEGKTKELPDDFWTEIEE